MLSEQSPAQGTTIRVDGIVAGYGRRRVLHGVDWVIRPGVTGLLGPNGAGKTTLLSVMVGLLQPVSGKVVVEHTDARFGFVPQRFSNGRRDASRRCDLVHGMDQRGDTR